MYYEETWIDGWLWTRTSPNAQFTKASEAQMIAKLREQLASWEDFRNLVTLKTEQAEMRDPNQAPFGLDANQSHAYVAGKASGLGWVMEMMPPS